MTTSSSRKLLALAMAIIVVMTGGAMLGSATQSDSAAQVDSGNQQADSAVVAEDVEAEEIEMQDVTISNLTVDVGSLEDPEEMINEAFGAGIGANVEGFSVESVDLGTVTSASISIENDVATIDANLESITLEGVEADEVRLNESSTVASLLQTGSFEAQQTLVSELSVGTLTVGEGEPPAETPTEEPTENVTEEPTDNVTEEPTDNVTETPTEEPADNLTETPTEEPTDNLTETPTEEPTDNVTETPTEEPTDNVTETPTEEPADNLTETPTEEPTDNLTETPTEEPTDNVTETPTEEPAEEFATVSFADQTTTGDTVEIDRVEMSDGGFVAIHNESLMEGDALGSVVGVSEYLDNGVHENVTVELFNVSGANVSEASLTETLIAMPHFDSNDNETYDFVATDGEADGPYVLDGEVVVDSAVVTVENETAN